MPGEVYPYSPDYATPPGWVLEEELEVRGISTSDFARQCQRPEKLIKEIIAGKAPIDPATASRFESVLNVNADYWLRMESGYRLDLARLAGSERTNDSTERAKGFSIREEEQP